jgi:PAS domain S-box-containing protein
VLSLDTQGRANAWNQRLLDLLHFPRELLLGRPNLHDLAQYQNEQGHIIDIDSRVQSPEQAVAAGWVGSDPSTLVPVYQRTGLDGAVLEVRTHVAADNSVVRTYTDVTANVRAQRALRESEERFRTMADGAPALVWQSDAQGAPSWFNQRWLAHTGRSMAQELALPWAARVHADDLARCRQVFEEAAAQRQGYSVEFRLLRVAGPDVWIADSGIPRFTPDGGFAGYIGYGWDITDRVAAKTALIAAKDEAERANRAKSEFLSRMSHELRTPLNAVLGFGQLLQSDEIDPLSTAQHARVQELLRGGRHLLRLINDVLDLARIEAGTLQLSLSAVEVADVVGDSLRLVQPMAAERGITLHVAAAPADAHAVQADATRLKQVLLNLLSNAIKYSHEGGQVHINWHRNARDRRVCIEVTDNGPGLNMAQQSLLFQAFERLDAERSSVEGAGIGLALSKWLVDLMHGEIGVTSAPGQGCTFWLQLAAAEGPSVVSVVQSAPLDAPVTPARPPARGAASVHVLYIEDNLVNQMLMQGMLAQRPAIVLRLAELPDAGLLMATQAPPDLILLDIQLPQMDGFEVLRRLRQHPATRAVPVVAVSANAMHSDIEQARQAGFADYVTKPLELARLLAVVDRVLATGV